MWHLWWIGEGGGRGERRPHQFPPPHFFGPSYFSRNFQKNHQKGTIFQVSTPPPLCPPPLLIGAPHLLTEFNTSLVGTVYVPELLAYLLDACLHGSIRASAHNICVPAPLQTCFWLLSNQQKPDFIKQYPIKLETNRIPFGSKSTGKW